MDYQKGGRKMRSLIAALVLGVMLAGCADDKDIERQRYCEMVDLWMTQAKAGVRPKDRSGWPPYDGVCK